MPLEFITGPRSNFLVHGGYLFQKEKTVGVGKVAWKCCEYSTSHCTGRCHTLNNEVTRHKADHNHPPPPQTVISKPASATKRRKLSDETDSEQPSQLRQQKAIGITYPLIVVKKPSETPNESLSEVKGASSKSMPAASEVKRTRKRTRKPKTVTKKGTNQPSATVGVAEEPTVAVTVNQPKSNSPVPTTIVQDDENEELTIVAEVRAPTRNSTGSKSKNAETLVIIDTDAGTDDAMAIFMMLAAHSKPEIPIRIIAITTVHGNTSVDKVALNVTRILFAANKLHDIPIFNGVRRPILDAWPSTDDAFHGEDGFGDADLPPMQPVIQEEHAVSAIIRLAYEYKEQIVILALGPLTNLALAARLDPQITSSIKGIYAMGGNVQAEGNAMISAEFNFAVDPEAAYITMSSYDKCPILLAPWEVCKTQGAPLEWRKNVLGILRTPEAELLNKIEAKILEKYPTWIPCDQLAAAALIEPEVYKSSKNNTKETEETQHCTIELRGRYTRGMMLIDHGEFLGKPRNVKLLMDIDTDLFRRIMIWGAGGPEYKSFNKS